MNDRLTRRSPLVLEVLSHLIVGLLSESSTFLFFLLLLGLEVIDDSAHSYQAQTQQSNPHQDITVLLSLLCAITLSYYLRNLIDDCIHSCIQSLIPLTLLQ